MNEGYKELEKNYIEQLKNFEETLSPEQKRAFYSIERLREELDNKKILQR